MLTQLFLAGKYLKPRRNAVSLITLSSVLGVTLGVAVLMVVLAVMTGFTDLMKTKLIETQAHFQVRRADGFAINDPAPVVKAVQAAGGTAAPVVMGPLLAQYDRTRLDPRVVVLGVSDAALRERLGGGALQLGTLNVENNHIVIGSSVAARWRVRPGDKVLLHSVRKLTRMVQFKPGGGIALNEESGLWMPREFTVSGIFSLGKYDFDNSVIFADQDDAAELFELPWGAATSVYGWGKDPFNQSELVGRLRQELPGYRVSTWEEDNRQLLDVLAVEKRMMFFLLIFIVLVAAFSITNTLITSVYQKTREIGVLKALGASDGMVTGIFVSQGLLIGVIGSGCGTLLGYLIITFRNHILRFASSAFNMDLFPKEFYFFNELPAHIIAGDVIFIVVSSIVLCTLGAVLPAWRASRISPAQALRYE